jgi:ribonuclease E
MTTRLLLDAAHPEETRVVIVRGSRLEDFDYESSTKTQLRGNIYLAKVTRVEPSLQAAFVDYGGNRHGFLAFSEIHPDYYQIPVADREKLLAAEAEAAEREAQQAAAEDAAAGATSSPPPDDTGGAGTIETIGGEQRSADAEAGAPIATPTEPAPPSAGPNVTGEAAFYVPPAPDAVEPPVPETSGELAAPPTDESAAVAEAPPPTADDGVASRPERSGPRSDERISDAGSSDDDDEAQRRRRRMRMLRSYRIQEVIKRRQILLVQVVKEERGNKGAALTTYLSLAGRYCVLMPNTARGGGISRKIVDGTDRRRLKSVVGELEVPKGMGLIVRTAGAERSRAEIKRDYEYLLRVWENVRDLTLKSTAPCLVYEEANLIKRAIRDSYSKDIDEILVEGEEAYKNAKNFMRLLMPSHAKRVKRYEERVPLFQRYQVEEQFDAMHSPQVRLKGGGYIVINPTEALVSIDVNSGRATKERNIEETALQTNLEAADEVARHLRLRDLGGLIVIDFIDMNDPRHNRAVEKRLKDALKADRARIQVGRISGFGLLEMSRQRQRPSLLEASTKSCEHCGGTGYVRSTESTALHVLRVIESEGMKKAGGEVTVHVATPVAIYLLNQKRSAIARIESIYGVRVFMAGDDTLIPPQTRIERTMTSTAPLPATAAIQADGIAERPPVADSAGAVAAADDESADEAAAETEAEAPVEAGERDERPARDFDRDRDRHRDRGRHRRDRHRRDRDRHRDRPPEQQGQGPQQQQQPQQQPRPHEGQPHGPRPEGEGGDGQRKRRRRGKRGGRRRRRGGDRGEGYPRDQHQPMQTGSADLPQSAPLGDHPIEHHRDAAPDRAPAVAYQPPPMSAESSSAWSTTEPAPVPRETYSPSPPRDTYTPPPPRPEPEPQVESAPPPVSEQGQEAPAGETRPARRGWWRRAFE